MEEPAYSQPLRTALQIALVDLLQTFIVTPSTIVGHSSGEMAAAAPSGAMMAVGLLEEAIETHLKAATDVFIGCVQSPKSVTLTGAEAQINALKPMLDRYSVFCRKLRVNIAYHSPHMQEMARDYVDYLQDLEPGEASIQNPKPLMISSVTGNMVSQKEIQTTRLFSINNKRSAKKLGASQALPQVTDILEIGRHCALESPIKDLLNTNTSNDFSYSAVMKRQAPAVETLLEALGQLFCAGHLVEVNAVNRLDEKPKSVQVVFPNLPEYQVDHSREYWHESRLSKDSYRLRKHPRLDLLGTPVPEWNPLAPRWRGFLLISAMPWIEDHKSLYQYAKDVGSDYGPAFQPLLDLAYSDTGVATGKVGVFQWFEGEQVMQPHTIHPATLDGLFQLMLVSLSKGTEKEILTIMPTRIGKLCIAGKGINYPSVSTDNAHAKALSQGDERLMALSFMTLSLEDPSSIGENLIDRQVQRIIPVIERNVSERAEDFELEYVENNVRLEISRVVEASLLESLHFVEAFPKELLAEGELEIKIHATGTSFLDCLTALSQVDSQIRGARRVGSNPRWAGGTGQAAIQVTRYLDAEIFVTIGSNEKKKLLREIYNIPDDHIFYSRDIYSHANLPMCQLRKNVTFSSVDLVCIMNKRPSIISKALTIVMTLLTEGLLHIAQPFKVFGISEIEDVSRCFQSGQHSGKMAIEMRGTDIVPTVLQTRPDYLFDPNASYVIAGGLGGLGQSAAKWMAEKGAKHFILLSWSGLQSGISNAFVQDLEANGVYVNAPARDVADIISLSAALTECAIETPPVRGVIQGSMVLKDAVLDLVAKPITQRQILIWTLVRYRVAQGEKATSLDLGWMQSEGVIAENASMTSSIAEVGHIIPICQDDFHALLDHYCNPNLSIYSPNSMQAVIGPELPAAILQKVLEESIWMHRRTFRHLRQIGLGESSISRAGDNVDYPALMREAASLEDATQVVTDGLLQKFTRALCIPPEAWDMSKPLHAYSVDSLLVVDIRN
ncbi:MAG: hypothetical protein Q9217_000850 [Psora testacea]